MEPSVGFGFLARLSSVAVNHGCNGDDDNDTHTDTADTSTFGEVRFGPKIPLFTTAEFSS